MSLELGMTIFAILMIGILGETIMDCRSFTALIRRIQDVEKENKELQKRIAALELRLHVQDGYWTDWIDEFNQQRDRLYNLTERLNKVRDKPKASERGNELLSKQVAELEKKMEYRYKQCRQEVDWLSDRIVAITQMIPREKSETSTENTKEPSDEMPGEYY